MMLFHLQGLHSDIGDRKMIMNGDQMQILKEVVLGKLKILIQDLLRETEENHKKPHSE
jgi:hypothetical protein